MPSFEQPLICYSVPDIDALTVGNYDIGISVVESGDVCFPMLVVVHIDAQLGSILTAPTISVGRTGATYNDILPNTALTGLVGQRACQTFLANGLGPGMADGISIKCRVSTAATMSGATPALQLKVGVFCVQYPQG